MELKQFQQNALKQAEAYLQKLAYWKTEADKNPRLKIKFPETAWEELTEEGHSLHAFHGKTDGLGRPLPNFCMKVPTGGGKTLLAIKLIDLANLHYRQSKTGLVLWIVPTKQIYTQTLKALRNKDHPYRQHLDNITAGRVQILERTDRFSPTDIAENLVVLLLMLPAANRENKETLKIFQDSSGFDQFFPLEDATQEHEAWLGKVPNLDYFGVKDGLLERRIKTSLGNTLRVLQPLIILDEGHKAYSEKAQATLAGFNPCLVLELSATPKPTSNKIVNVSGRELEKEEMLKLDLHVYNEAEWDWRDTLRNALQKRKELEDIARDYESRSGRYIRPIMLIQVERTGKDKRDDSRFTHAEQIKEHLINVEGIPKDQVAIKASDTDDLSDIDDDDGLLSSDCPVRFIITKYALQEGWDCPFAYVLAILTNAGAKTALTQLIGRILRQPGARKTKVRELDESYVYAYQQKPTEMIAQIKDGFENEGLGDLAGRLSLDRMAEADAPKLITSAVREKFQKAVSTAFLPVFACPDGKDTWRPVSYAMDIEQHINWGDLDLAELLNLPLSNYRPTGESFALGFTRSGNGLIEQRDVRRLALQNAEVDPFYLARVLSDELIPNPWIASNVTEQILDGLQAKYGGEMVAGSFVYIVEQAKQFIQTQKDKLAQAVFDKSLKQDNIRLTILADKSTADWFKPRQVRDSKRLTTRRGEALQLSLFDVELEETYNDLEQEVAWFLEDQNQLFFWWRNIPRHGYHLQGWKKNRIFPDFVFSTDFDGVDDFKVFVVETKGIHLKNDDTDYKKAVFSIADKHAKSMTIPAPTFAQAVKQRDIRYAVVHSDKWQQEFRRMIQG